MLPLHSLGERIVVVGPSQCGQVNVGSRRFQKLGLPAVHLDQLQHRPQSNWQARPESGVRRSS